jgi:hypothetical protein
MEISFLPEAFGNQRFLFRPEYNPPSTAHCVAFVDPIAWFPSLGNPMLRLFESLMANFCGIMVRIPGTNSPLSTMAIHSSRGASRE